MAKVTPKDYVIDPARRRPHGDHCGEARPKAFGIEYNPEMVELSKRNAAKAGVSDKATSQSGPLRDDFGCPGDYDVSVEYQYEAPPQDSDLKPAPYRV
jgi:hypothetical protein